MRSSDEQYELQCPVCDARQWCDQAAMLNRLRQLGMFRRQADPPAEMIVQLFRESVERFRCADCQHVGMVAQVASDDDWADTRSCSSCGAPIPAARLELFPDAKRCAACESQAESPQEEDREFCPRCGNVMRLEPQHGRGVTRYTLVCPSCRR
jgi:transcription elongation factor Elf1